jgi:hypothetical protein
MLPFEINTQHEEFQAVTFHVHRATIRDGIGDSTFDEGDLQMSVRTGDSNISSWRQSRSVSTLGLSKVVLTLERKVENMLLRLS